MSSSDGQRFPMRGKSLTARALSRYFVDEGVSTLWGSRTHTPALSCDFAHKAGYPLRCDSNRIGDAADCRRLAMSAIVRSPVHRPPRDNSEPC
jgi:hypothetical protein